MLAQEQAAAAPAGFATPPKRLSGALATPSTAASTPSDRGEDGASIGGFGASSSGISDKHDKENVKASSRADGNSIKGSFDALDGESLIHGSSSKSVASLFGGSGKSGKSGKSIRSGRRESLVLRMSNNSIGSSWTVEMTCIKKAGTYFEAVECLRRIKELLNEVDRADRLRFCKVDFDNMVLFMRKLKKTWSAEIVRDCAEVSSIYFNQSPFRLLPEDLILAIFLWLPIEKFAPIYTVCSAWHDLACCNQIWSIFYRQKFLIKNPGPSPSMDDNVMHAFRSRLLDPQIGDKVEVAWRGKFRLETQDVYQGLAWWVAEVVDKHKTQGRYKIRYPGWESRWDEWVPRNRLRWAVQRNEIEVISPHDSVELWCCGANVPGAWLECRVKRVKSGNRYCIDRVVSSGPVWVPRERLRLVRRHVSNKNASSSSRTLASSTTATTAAGAAASADGRAESVRNLGSRSISAISASFHSMSERIGGALPNNRNTSCTIM